MSEDELNFGRHCYRQIRIPAPRGAAGVIRIHSTGKLPVIIVEDHP